MKTSTFARFVAPSVLLMLALLAMPLAVTFYLSVRNCTFDMETVTIQQSGPFGSTETTTQRARVDANGKPIQNCKFVGTAYFKSVLGLTGASGQTSASSQEPPADTAATGNTGSSNAAKAAASKNSQEFIGALRFTLLYTLVTTPLVIIFGFFIALGVHHSAQRLKAVFITVSLLPFIITPIVGALAIKWLFRDGGLVPHVLSQFGLSIYWMAEAWSARLLVILYGVWQSTPFAFIVFYAGLQSVPQDSLEAATIDGATRWQKLIYITLPHMMPLVLFVALIKIMDSYRVFEPVVVLTQGAFTTSVQYLTYHILSVENNPYKASASAVLTTLGIGILIIPMLYKTWKEQRSGR
ncbi:sugar ABC transporter permease [Variovorax sp. PCZ-1]|uniref:carbohydrate ABC transporter permease n=1 Tax=Variovorax sp. PCZ-1 TaxID=2835533 RepID=UPI001BCADAB1|nr:sugar ABC transporter permease [Variovorax sp. PCZ-1]MBS7807909.1 sugar ABC transporter permease [Variovorax sp. PCZ-1]